MDKLNIKRNRMKIFGFLAVVFIAGGFSIYDQIGFGSRYSGEGVAEPGKPVESPLRLFSLTAMESLIRLHYPEISHVSSDELQSNRVGSDGSKLVLLDVREPGEFQVSHLDGAIQLAPDASVEQVIEAVGDVSGRDIVFYCSVGARSSKLARKTKERLNALGARSVANLSGGIFRWHNEERELVDKNGPTQLVHQYDDYWGQLIRRKELKAGKPLD